MFWIQVGLRMLAWACLLWLGGRALWALVIDPEGNGRMVGGRGPALVAGVLVLTRLAQLYAQTWLFFTPDEAVGPRTMWTVAGSTSWGTGWLAQAGVAVALLVAAVAAGRVRTRGQWPIAGGVLLAAMVEPLTGHAGERGLGSLAWWLQSAHLAGAVVWVGGLAALAGALRSEPDPGAIRRAVDRFSPLALGGAALLVASGALTGWLYAESLATLWSTAWGRTLSLKVALVAGVAGLGLYNWRSVRPRLGSAAATTTLRRSASIELALAVLALAASAVLVALPPSGE